MVIPSGDLAPLRKHRRYGRRRSHWPVLLAVLAVLAVAATAYVVVTQRGDSADRVTAAPTCSPSPAASQPPPTAARLPAPRQVSLRLLNGTGRDGLARTVAAELTRRGFRVTYTGNAPRALTGASRVYYGPGARPAALLVSAHVLGSSVTPVSTAARGAIDVVLGSGFVRLRTPAETSAYTKELVAVPTPAASGSCR